MSVGQNRPSESNQDDPKMSDPSPHPTRRLILRLETGEDEPQAGTLLIARWPWFKACSSLAALCCWST